MARIVGVTGTNVLNYYYISLNVALTGGCGKVTPDAKGDLALSADLSGNVFSTEPIREITSATALTKDIYFVPAFDFKGITVNGSAVDVTNVVGDDVSLWKLASGATLTKISL